jgi:hypothetical protein
MTFGKQSNQTLSTRLVGERIESGINSITRWLVGCSRKHRPERPIPGARFNANQLYLDRYRRPAYLEAVDELKAPRRSNLTRNLEALNQGPLRADVVTAGDGVWNRLRGITPKYNR